MDPNATLQELLGLVRTIRRHRENACTCRAEGIPCDAGLGDDAERAATLLLALDDWLRRGGFLPAPWAMSR